MTSSETAVVPDWKDSISRDYGGVATAFRLYWKLYGGRRALLRSPYLHVSVLLGALVWTPWDYGTDGNWTDLCFQTLPNLLGFSLGGYAMLLAFSDREFIRRLIADGEDGRHGPYMTVNASFVHFILVQVATLLAALLGKAWGLQRGLFAWIGFSLFVYSLLTGVAAVMGILRFVTWYKVFLRAGTQASSQKSNDV